jgi:alanine dehydrogenase
MKIGIPKEIKNHEYRVGLTPAGAKALVKSGHEVVIERDAGTRIGYTNEAYINAGAKICESAAAAYDSPMVVKVKEPQTAEFELMHEGQVLFTYLHLAPDAELTRNLLEQKIIGIAYETVVDNQGRLPLLTPMSEVAGRIAIQVGAWSLQMANGGNGKLLGGVPGTPPGKVLVVGGGVVGTQAARMALGLGADVTILDNNLDRLRYLDDIYGPSLKTRFSDQDAIDELTQESDIVVGAVLIPGKQAPKLITMDHIKNMSPGSVLVDVAIDQGGCAETSRATTHSDPVYIVEEVVHYCVANMPGACARTSTHALTNATIPYVMKLADLGYQKALADDAGFLSGLNLYLGSVTNQFVAEDLGYEYIPPQQVIG